MLAVAATVGTRVDNGAPVTYFLVAGLGFIAQGVFTLLSSLCFLILTLGKTGYQLGFAHVGMCFVAALSSVVCLWLCRRFGFVPIPAKT